MDLIKPGSYIDIFYAKTCATTKISTMAGYNVVFATLLFQHFKTCSQEGSPGLYLHPRSTQALVLLCISAMDIITSIFYVQRRFGWLVGCIIVLWPFDTF